MMTNSIQKIIFIFSLIAVIGCNQPTTNIGYININKVYSTNENIKSFDTLLKKQKEQMNVYGKQKSDYLNSLKLSDKKFNQLAKAYQDTMKNYESKVNQQYQQSLNSYSIKIQEAIDKISKQKKYDFVLSHHNQTLLYVRDTTNNITQFVIDELKVEK